MNAAPDQLRAYVERILRMKEEAADRAAIRAAYVGLTGEQKTRVGLLVRERWQPKQGWCCYFAAFPKAGLLKIGISRDVQKRIASLSGGKRGRGELLLDFPGMFALEGWYHAAFSEHRIEGEWFRLNDTTRSLVESIRVSGPVIRLEAA